MTFRIPAKTPKPLIVTVVAVFTIICGFIFFTAGERNAEAQNKSPEKSDLFAEQQLSGNRVEPTVKATVKFSDILEYEKTYQPPSMEYILQSKGKRPRNPPAEEMPPAPDSLIKRKPGMFFDLTKNLLENPVVPQVASPSPNLDFQGLGDANTSIPPDTHGAIGPNHIMTALNTQVRIQSKTGTTVSTVSLNSFFASVGGGGGTFDPRVLYDPYQNRWICVAVDDAAAATSKVLIAVSQTNDPTGTWNFYGYDHDAANLEWADYPMVGFNKNWIAVSINDFANVGNTFQGANCYIFDKSTLYAGAVSPTVTKVQVGTAAASLGNVHQPVETYDNTTETLYIIQRWNSTAGQLRVYTITGTPAAPTLTATGLFPTSTGWSTTAVAAPQSGGGAITITNNDSRMQRVVLRNGSIWAAHTIFLTSPSRTGVQWWQFNPTNAVITQVGRIEDSTGTNFYAFPSIAVNAANQALIGYSAFSATTFASAAYSYRGVTDATTTTRDPLRYKNGLACYRKTFGGGTNRWGDYSNTLVDPVDDSTFWTLQEYAETPVGGDCTTDNTGRWGVWWAKVIPPCTSVVTSGNWNVAATWGCNAIPTAADDAVIAQNQTVTLNVNPSAAKIVVNQGGTLAVSGNRTVGTSLLVNGTLNLTGGILDMGSNTLTIGCTGTVTGASATGYVIGNVTKEFCAAGSFTYPVGENGYTPVAVNATAVSTVPATLTIDSVDSALSGLAANNAASRYWNLTGSGLTADLSFTYTDADVTGNESSWSVFKRIAPNPPTNQCAAACVNAATNTGTVTGVSSFSEWGVGSLVPSAASVNVGGRVFSADGRAISRAIVSMTDADGRVRTATTNTFGYYRFDAVQTGQTYTLNVKRKGYSFDPRVVEVSDELTNLDITALP